jgi:hypothetical protein
MYSYNLRIKRFHPQIWECRRTTTVRRLQELLMMYNKKKQEINLSQCPDFKFKKYFENRNDIIDRLDRQSRDFSDFKISIRDEIRKEIDRAIREIRKPKPPIEVGYKY